LAILLQRMVADRAGRLDRISCVFNAPD